ncbi:carbohydrate ABC transporter permease [Clostridium oryzae]|uniref:L-arabinose transport system permease protein AraQ n=1 Tax=Clostridium oryzae TaxID=1450648 RepID=A0A1V4I494_9CLOT|nr:carbohydrate ABC transporter permease [Clostridium oryzae]OPJ54719.1 L-arabinose transport system permease protein AraQ [Clostridium oryzae]
MNSNIVVKKGLTTRITKVRPLRALFYIILILFGLLNIYPLIWMALTSFKTNQQISTNTFSLPTSFHFENYAHAWKTANIGTYFINSAFVAIISIIVTVLLGAMAAYILAKFKFKLRGFIYTLFMFGMLIPVHSLLVPLFIQMRFLHLLNTRWALIFPYVAFAFPITIFILESFMRAFPNDIEEAAVIDGCSIPRLFLKIILPMTRPAIATVVILDFLNNWNEFAFALVLVSNDKLKTLPIGLVNFIGGFSSDYAQMMAAMVISALPTIILYFFLQDYIIKGMTQGALKD